MINLLSTLTLPSIILFIFIYASYKKVAIYEEFIEGAKDGFSVSVKIIPYLVALIVAISMFRASGCIDYIANLFAHIIPSAKNYIDILPLAITRSLSGSATLGLFAELVSKHGANNFTTYLAAIMVGSSETTFYVLSVYFGAIGIKKFRYAILTGIIADIIGIVLSILVAQYFFLPNIG